MAAKHRALVRSRRGRPRTAVVSDAWQRWVADNLLRGVDAVELAQGLMGGGVPEALAVSTVAGIQGSPGLAIARQQQRTIRQRSEVLRLLTAVREPLTVERREAPSLEELHARYWATSTPAIFTDIVSGWKRQWTPRSLQERFGEVRIEACVGREADPRPDANWREHRMELSLSEFIDRMLDHDASNDLYLIANNRNTARDELRELWDDVVLPEGWFAEDRLPFGSALWLGPAGTITPLHHDTSNILFCQIHGRKRIVLAPPWVEALLDSAHGVYNHRSPADLVEEGIESVELMVEPGEALFIPGGWWHDVRAVDASVSLAINAFAKDNRYDWYRPGRTG